MRIPFFHAEKAGGFISLSILITVDFKFQYHVVPVEGSVPDSNQRARFTILNTISQSLSMTFNMSKQDWPGHNSSL